MKILQICVTEYSPDVTTVNIGGLSIGETAKGTAIDAMGKPVVPIDPVCVRVQTSSSRRDSNEPVIRSYWNPEPFQLSHVTMSRETDREKESVGKKTAAFPYAWSIARLPSVRKRH